MVIFRTILSLSSSCCIMLSYVVYNFINSIGLYFCRFFGIFKFWGYIQVLTIFQVLIFFCVFFNFGVYSGFKNFCDEMEIF